MGPSLSRRRLLATVATVGVGGLGVELLVGPRPTLEGYHPAPGEWPATRRGPRRTAAAPGADPPRSTPSLDWRTETDAGARVVVADGTVFTGSEDGVAAMALDDGSRLWDRSVPGTELCYGYGTLFCTGRKETPILALDADDGSERWRTSVESEETSDLLLSGSTILVGHDGVSALDAHTGAVRWRVAGGSLTHVAVDDGTLYGSGYGGLERYRVRRGWDAVLASAPRKGKRSGGFARQARYPVVTDDGVYTGEIAGGIEEATASVHGFSRDDATRRWTTLEKAAVTSPAIAGDLGVVGAYDDGEEPPGRLVGIDHADGTIRWERPVHARLVAPVVADDLAIAATLMGPVRAVDATTGDLAWKTTVQDSVDSIVPVGDRIVVGGRGRSVRCLR